MIRKDYYIYCPHCGEEIVIKKDELDVDIDSFEIECKHCKKEVHVEVEYKPIFITEKIERRYCMECGEEFGFIGGCAVIVLLIFISFECIMVARKAKDIAGTIIASGVAALIGFQGMINISVATGVIPNTGIPLPFVSYGLTSLVSLYIGVGFVLNVRLQCKK